MSAAIASLVYKLTPAIAVFPILSLKLNSVVPAGINFTFDALTASFVIFSFVSVMICPCISATDTHKLLPVKYSGFFLDGVPPMLISQTVPRAANGYLLFNSTAFSVLKRIALLKFTRE